MQLRNSRSVTDRNTDHRRNVLIVTGIFPPDIGGPASYVPRIASELVRRGWEVTVITLSDALDQDDSSYSFCVIRLPRFQSKLLRVPRTIRKISRQAKDADLLFANGLFLESAIASWRRRKPLVMKIVGDWAWERCVNKGWTDDTIDEFQTKRHSLGIRAFKKLRSIVTQRADVVFTPSCYLRRIVEGWGVEKNRLQVIYNALRPLSNVPPIALPPFTGSTVVTVARLVVWKGIDRLIQIVSSLFAVRLIVIGDGPEKRSLECLAAELDLGERIIFTGQVLRETVEQYLRGADVFVLNSTYEGLPHVVLEAMAAGLPVIATDVGGTGELVQHEVNGLLVPPMDDEALRSAICRLLETPDERKRFVDNGFRTIAGQFQWSQLAESTEELLASASYIYH